MRASTRTTLALVSAAVTSMVAIAFLIPLAVIVRDVARDRAFTSAQLTGAVIEPVLSITTDRATLERAIVSTPAGAAGQLAVYLTAPLAAGGTPGIWGLAADTDGVDGAVDIAGAIFTPDTLARARANGRDPQAMLDDNDGHSFFEMLGDSLVTGPTRTNVNDFRATLIAP